MRKLLKLILESEYDRRRRLEEEYLAESVDIVDLERRQRLLNVNPNLRGWV